MTPRSCNCLATTSLLIDGALPTVCTVGVGAGPLPIACTVGVDGVGVLVNGCGVLSSIGCQELVELFGFESGIGITFGFALGATNIGLLGVCCVLPVSCPGACGLPRSSMASGLPSGPCQLMPASVALLVEL